MKSKVSLGGIQGCGRKPSQLGKQPRWTQEIETSSRVEVGLALYARTRFRANWRLQCACQTS